MGESSLIVIEWMKFFKDAGIPKGLGSKYSVLFTDHRITNDLLGDLTREILSDMGIKVMGDVIAILKQAKVVSEQLNREKNSKLLDGNYSARESPNGGASKVKTITKQQNSPKNRTKEVASGSSSPPTSVFNRLGEDPPTPESSGVFNRLGEPVAKTTSISEPQQRVSRIKVVKKPTKQASPVKRKSALERLGPEKSDNVIESKQRKLVTAPAKTVIVKKLSTNKIPEIKTGESSSEPVQVVKFRASSLNTQKLLAKENPPSQKTANIMKRLGAKVTSTTPSSGSGTSVKIIRKSLPLKMKQSPPKYSRLQMKTPLGSRKLTSKPISSNHVSSTTSAGIFKGGAAAESESVFNRLGRK